MLTTNSNLVITQKISTNKQYGFLNSMVELEMRHSLHYRKNLTLFIKGFQKP